MARIQTYANDTEVTGDERLIGTDANGDTINIPIDSLQTHILQDGVYDGIVPQNRYVRVGADGGPSQGLIYETSASIDDVPIPSSYVFFLGRDGEGFFVELRRFGLTSTAFPFDITSFIGKSWVSAEYPTAGGQVLTSFLDPAFDPTSTADNQTWRFRTTIAMPLNTDSIGTGRALVDVVISSLDRRTFIIGGDLEVLGAADALAGGGDTTTVVNGPAVANQYVSGATVTGGAITFSRAALTSARLATKTLTSADASILVEGFNLIPLGTMGLNAPLPASPTPGDFAIIANLSGIPGNTISRNGQLIQGNATDLVLDDHTASFQITFFNETVGWIITGAN